MKLVAPPDYESLAALGADAVDLLRRGDINTLAQRYGYALSYGQVLATAIRESLGRCLSEAGATSLAPGPTHAVRRVAFYKPNSSNLIAVVECLASTNNGASVLVELVVTALGAERHITLEDITLEDQAVA